MKNTIDKPLGLLITIVGVAILISFAYKFIFHAIGVVAAVIIINYGLKLQGSPGLIFTAIEMYKDGLNFKFKK